MHALRTILYGSSALVLVGLGAVIAGPLNPPAGPVAPTYKTLSELEPRTAVQSLAGDATAQHVITQPGSYYLTGPITGVSGKYGIRIAANDVTIDLCGQTMNGNNAGTRAIVVDQAGWRGITIRSGILSNWVTIGLDAAAGVGCRFESLQVRGTGTGTGLVAGQGSLVTGCSATANPAGILTQASSLVSDCIAEANSFSGIQIADGCSALRCQVGSTPMAIQCGSGCTLADCTARAGAYGIYAGEECTIRRCSVMNNTSGGIQVTGGSGIWACQLRGNQNVGIAADGSGNSVGDCSTSGSAGDGIRVGSSSLVRRNYASISTTGSWNRIDSNTAGNNGTVNLGGTANLLVRQHASLPSYLISPGNGNAAIISGFPPYPYPWGNFAE
jgi:hypothetical protein